MRSAQLFSACSFVAVSFVAALNVGCDDPDVVSDIDAAQESGPGTSDAPAESARADVTVDVASESHLDAAGDSDAPAGWDGVPIKCGNTMCSGINFTRYAPPPCCPEGPTSDVCGARPGYDNGIDDCVAYNQPGVPVDVSVCPLVHQTTSKNVLEWPGCCRPDNKCGAWNQALPFGCAINDQSLEGGAPKSCDYAAAAADAGVDAAGDAPAD